MERIDHITVVDDDRDIRELIVDYLEKSGYRASGAANGKAMWSVLKNHQIDLIVLDIMMPGEDGNALPPAARQPAAGYSGADAHRPHRRQRPDPRHGNGG